MYANVLICLFLFLDISFLNLLIQFTILTRMMKFMEELIAISYIYVY